MEYKIKCCKTNLPYQKAVEPTEKIEETLALVLQFALIKVLCTPPKMEVKINVFPVYGKKDHNKLQADLMPTIIFVGRAIKCDS